MGTASFTVPIPASPGRDGFGPDIAIGYGSASGNGPFGLGWALNLPSIARKTDSKLPRYRDGEDSDAFFLSGLDDLVPFGRVDGAGDPILDARGNPEPIEEVRGAWRVRRYRLRVEGTFALIERWTSTANGADVHWRTISRDNVLTIFGLTAESRIQDAEDPRRIFEWLVSEVRDDRGNAMLYRYRSEDGEGIDHGLAHQQSRGNANDPRRRTNRYLKRVHYGNLEPLLDAGGKRPLFLDEDVIESQLASHQWMFELVLDYGDHDEERPTPGDDSAVAADGSPLHPWPERPDPFSSYRPGFEVRTSRLCRRALMFHHFEDEDGVGIDCLVRSLRLDHEAGNDESGPTYSRLVGVTETGHVRTITGYDSKSLPTLSLEYSEPKMGSRVEAADPADIQDLPDRFGRPVKLWVDLHGEGIPGLLLEEGDAWHYRRNLSPLGEGARLGPAEPVAAQPSARLVKGATFLDLDGSGTADLVLLDAPEGAGAFRHDDREGWKDHSPFAARLVRDWQDPNLKLIDLDGDGLADVLITEEDAIAFHPALDEGGFGEAEQQAMAADERFGPRLVLSDGRDSIFLADMNGDGLPDLCRIRNGSIAYWPGLGFGLFGARVLMDQAPSFDHPDQFDPERLRLVDLDGTGTTDLAYLHAKGVRLWFNQSGNGWSKMRRLDPLSAVDPLRQVEILDLLGNGTSCLVMADPGPGASRPLSYVDLMGGRPHLLTRILNNMGGETRIGYAPATKFALKDRREGRPWATSLPFPLQVVERIERIDWIAKTRHAVRFAYHHGHYDADDREFRGFGMVEQWDSESVDDHLDAILAMDGRMAREAELNQPPILTRTWRHTGAFQARKRLEDAFEAEFFEGRRLPDETIIPDRPQVEDVKACLRALKGMVVREEIYSPDGSADAGIPYGLSENAYEVRLLQPAGKDTPAVVMAVDRSSITVTLERNSDDPRISQSFALEVDDLGLTRKSCQVAYGRATLDASLPAKVQEQQRELHVQLADTEVLPDQSDPEAGLHRLRVRHVARGFEVTGITPDDGLFTFDELAAKIDGATEIAHHETTTVGQVERRLVSHSLLRFLSNDLTPLPLGQWDTLGLIHQSFVQAFSSGSIGLHFGAEVGDGELEAAGYVELAGRDGWWIPSGEAIYPADAAQRFYRPIGTKDPFGIEVVATFDDYQLLTERISVVQAPWNVIRATNDYRLLAPVGKVDPNGNGSLIATDALGMVIAHTVTGKAGEGDSLADPTARIEYDLEAWAREQAPASLRTFAREVHGPANPRFQESVTYFDAMGGVALSKSQAPPGPALAIDDQGEAIEVDADPRWTGTGRSIRNNKGNVVKTYEPYFSASDGYEDSAALRESGVTAVRFYDPVGRLIRFDRPDGTFERFEFDPWSGTAFDASDTVLESQWYADRGSPDPTGAEPASPDARAAWAAARHADTPAKTYLDSLGRPVMRLSDLGGGQAARTRIESDVDGRTTRLFDALDRLVATSKANMAGLVVEEEAAERGHRFLLSDISGAAVRAWDDGGRRLSQLFDALRRPFATRATDGAGNERVINFVVYGDRLADGADKNLLGSAHLAFDTAGLITVAGMDFKGTPLSFERQLAKDLSQLPDWGILLPIADVDDVLDAASNLLEMERFTSRGTQDALGRPLSCELADGTIIIPTFDEANSLKTLAAKLPGAAVPTIFLSGQEHNARGQRLKANFGNGLASRYEYDPNTFRLTQMVTALDGVPGAGELQKLSFTYDPVGNVMEVADAAQPTLFFNNAVVPATMRFTYDAVHQLARASGRELAALSDSILLPGDKPPMALPHANDAAAVRAYVEEYEFDLLGNIRTLRHRPAGGPGGWVRHYRYALDDDPSDCTNRLTATSAPGDPDAGPFTHSYTHDANGNMTSMPHLTGLSWNVLDQLARVDLAGGGEASYAYEGGGRRIFKRVSRPGGLDLEWIMLGPLTIHRRRRKGSGELRFERHTLRISDDHSSLAEIDLKLLDDDGLDPANSVGKALIRYQLGNQLGSAAVETDDAGNLLSYEEYHPFGTTAYRSAKPGHDVSLKRHRFKGAERDSETGLDHVGARYYASWLGRWTSSDPLGFASGLNSYAYCHNDPVGNHDPNGLDVETSIAGKPDHIKKAQTTRTEKAGKVYEAYIRGITIEIDGKTYVLKGGKRQWNNLRGHWWIVGGELVEVAPPTVTDETAEPGGQSKQPPLESKAPPSQSVPPETPPPETPPPEAPPAESPPQNSSETPPAANDNDKGGGDADKGPEDATSWWDWENFVPHPNTGGAAAGTWDSAQRSAYIDKNKSRAAEAVKKVQEAKAANNVDEAVKTAETASNERAAARTATQKKLTPGGRTMSEAVDQKRDFESSWKEYAERRPGSKVPAPTSDKFEIAERVAKGSGQSNKGMTRISKVGKVLGPIALAIGLFFSARNIWNADPSERGRVASGEAGSFVGGLIGASLGTSAGVALAGGVTAFLIGLGIVSGPIGWLVLGLGIIGGLLGAWAFGNLGRAMGEGAYDLAE